MSHSTYFLYVVLSIILWNNIFNIFAWKSVLAKNICSHWYPVFLLPDSKDAGLNVNKNCVLKCCFSENSGQNILMEAGTPSIHPTQSANSAKPEGTNDWESDIRYTSVCMYRCKTFICFCGSRFCQLCPLQLQTKAWDEGKHWLVLLLLFNLCREYV